MPSASGIEHQLGSCIFVLERRLCKTISPPSNLRTGHKGPIQEKRYRVWRVHDASSQMDGGRDSHIPAMQTPRVPVLPPHEILLFETIETGNRKRN